MLKIAICEDSEIFVEIIKKNIETILKVPYELHPFLSGKEFYDFSAGDGMSL